jgi:hypothetical protein
VTARAAVQPGVEAVTFGARQTVGRTKTGAAALDKIPGGALGPEEIVLGSAAKAGRGAKRATDKLRDSASGLSVPSAEGLRPGFEPSPRQQDQIDAVRNLERRALARKADGQPPGSLSDIEFRRDAAGLLDTDRLGFPIAEGPGSAAGETATRLDDGRTADPKTSPPELDTFSVPDEAFPSSGIGVGGQETTPRGTRAGDVAAGPNISFESVADQLPDNVRSLLEDESGQASLVPTGRQRDPERRERDPEQREPEPEQREPEQRERDSEPDRSDPLEDARERQRESQTPSPERGRSPFEEIRQRREQRNESRTEPVDQRPLQFGYQRFAADDSGLTNSSGGRGATDMIDAESTTGVFDRLSAASESLTDDRADTGFDELLRATPDIGQRSRQDSRQDSRQRNRQRNRTRQRTRQRSRNRQRTRQRSRNRQRNRTRQRTRQRTRDRKGEPPDLFDDEGDDGFDLPTGDEAAEEFFNPVASTSEVLSDDAEPRGQTGETGNDDGGRSGLFGGERR